MNLFELTRALVDIESTTNHEKHVGDYVFAHLSAIAARHNGQIERIPVELNRDNVFACWGGPIVTFSTHMDTVPPFFASHEDNEFIWGRGSCDAKGIMASMIAAAEKLLAAGTRNFGVLFVVGEERNSAGAKAAAQILAAHDFSSMESLPRTASLSVARARCATKSPRRESWRIPRIRSSVIPRFTRSSMSSARFARFHCRKTRCSDAAR